MFESFVRLASLRARWRDIVGGKGGGRIFWMINCDPNSVECCAFCCWSRINMSKCWSLADNLCLRTDHQ